jgi:hypothetical protein
MGFIKRGEFEALKQQVAELTSAGLIGTKRVKEERSSKKAARQKLKTEASSKADKKADKKSEKKLKKKSSDQKNSKTAKMKKVK